MTACAGLLIGCMCLPLPGWSKHTLELLGWKTDGVDAEWGATQRCAADGLSFVATVSGTSLGIQMVGVKETTLSRAKARLNAALSRVCDGQSCSASGVVFRMLRCGDTIILFRAQLSDAGQAEAFCGLISGP